MSDDAKSANGPSAHASSATAAALDTNSASMSAASNNRERQVEEEAPVALPNTTPEENVAVAPEITQAASSNSSAGASALPQRQEAPLRPSSPRSTSASPVQARDDAASVAQPHTLALSDPQQGRRAPAEIAQGGSNNSSPQQSSQPTRPRNRALGDAPRLDGGCCSSSQTSSVVSGDKRGIGKAAGPARELLDESGIGGAGDELELSVPSHQEHLTADGQRCGSSA